MAKQWRRYAVDPGKYNYHAGQTVNILWNVAETGCGSAPVTIVNKATAGLYDYTPYQPNAAALANFPGEGDRAKIGVQLPRHSGAEASPGRSGRTR